MSQARFGHLRGAATVVGLVAALAGQVARAATTDGTLLTNIASASFSTMPNNSIGFNVSYMGSAYVLVMVPGLAVSKQASPTVSTSGNDVTFTIWAVNTSVSSSAWGVVITDKLPDNTLWDSATFTNWWNPSGGVPAGWFLSWSTNAGASWTAGVPTVGQGVPLWLKFTTTVLSPGFSGFVSYNAKVS